MLQEALSVPTLPCVPTDSNSTSGDPVEKKDETPFGVSVGGKLAEDLGSRVRASGLSVCPFWSQRGDLYRVA